jgi:acyl-CoA synthetase (AMP-forming)/AMP-acid ligase II
MENPGVRQPVIRHELHYRGRVVRCFAERPPHVDAMFRQALARFPDREALILGEQRITYRALDEVVEAVAGNLSARGFRQGDRLALLLGNCLEFVYAVLGAARIGVATVPMNPRQRKPEIAFVLNQCEATGLVYEAALADQIPDRATVPHLREAFVVGGAGDVSFDGLIQPARAPPCAIAEEDLFCLLYTSGTTGEPKGAMLTHLGVIHSVMHYQHGMRLAGDDVSVLAVPASHVTGIVAIILAMMRVGGCTVFMQAFKARAFLELAARERMTHALMVPAMYNLCLLEPDFGRIDLTSWRIGGFGGAPMPEATIARLAEMLPRLMLINAYGATETTSPATLLPLGDIARHPDSVGKALPCADVIVTDDDGREVPPGTSGEVWIAGPMVVPGYWSNPEADASAFAGGYWRSGDIGSIDADGYLRILDRKKDMINRGGYKVYSVEVENVLAHHPGVIECAVVGRPDRVLGERVQAFVYSREPSPNEGDLRAFCAERLSDYKVPEIVTFLREALPRNANGKILKALLRARDR